MFSDIVRSSSGVLVHSVKYISLRDRYLFKLSALTE